MSEPPHVITDATLLYINVGAGGRLSSVVRDNATGVIVEVPAPWQGTAPPPSSSFVGGGTTMLHPATAQILRWFTSGHLPAHLATVVSDCYGLAERMAEAYPAGGPELTAGLRHLLEAKDCFVRAAIVQREHDDLEGVTRDG